MATRIAHAANSRTTLLIVLLLVIALGLALLFGGSTLEDAYITFRYVRNLAEGAGLGVWNAGQQPVEGATSFLWMLLLGAGAKLGISPFLLSKVIGLASLLGIILLFGLLSRSAMCRGDEQTSRAALAAAVLAAVYIPLAWYSVTGMETTFFSLLVAVMVVSVVADRGGIGWLMADGAVIILLVLLRPEGMLFGLFLTVFKIFFSGRKDAARFLLLAAFVFAVIGIVGFRLVHFGSPLPNTYYAKASGEAVHFIVYGIRYSLSFLSNTWAIWLVVVAGGFIARKRRDWTPPELMLGLITAIYFAYVVRVGGDPLSAFPFWRHFVHLAPVWLFLAGMAISRLCRDNARAIALSTVAGVLTAATMLTTATTMKHAVIPNGLKVYPGFATRQPENAYFDFVNRFVDHDQIAAVALAGQWGWYVPITVIDMLGLNDRHIAHFGKFQKDGALDSKTDMPYVMAQKPTIVDGYMSGLDLRHGHCPAALHGARSDMLLDMLKSPDFMDTFHFVSNAPYEVIDRAIFISASLADAAKSAGAELVPLRETVLNDHACLH